MTGPQRTEQLGTVGRGARLVASSQVLLQASRVFTSIALARLLVPEDFGLAAWATLVNLFFETIRDLGTGHALVQRREVTTRQLSTVFFTNLVVGVLLTILIVVLAPGFTHLVGEPDARPYIQVASLAMLVQAATSVHRSVIQRRLDFRRLAVIDVCNALAGAVVAVVLAWRGWGAWSIVGSMLATAASSAVITAALSGFRPTMEFKLEDLRQIASYSRDMALSRVVNFFTRNGDKVIVGARFDAIALGYYQLANRLILYPMDMTRTVFADVLFPAFSRIQDDDEAIGRSYLRGVAMIALVMFPVVLGLVAVAEPLVVVVLGPKWEPAVPVITIIALVGLIQALTSTTGVLFQAKGRADIQLGFAVVAGVVTMSAYWIGGLYSPEGVALGFLISMVLLAYPSFVLAFRLIGLGVPRLLAQVAPLALAAGTMCALTYGVRRLLEQGAAADSVVLAASVGTGVVVYSALLWVFRVPAVGDLMRIALPARLLETGWLAALARRCSARSLAADQKGSRKISTE